jgi:hypothetical protein
MVRCGAQFKPYYVATNKTRIGNLSNFYRYAHYDNAANFNDFVAFGGWTKAYAKQYEGDVTVCGYENVS